MKAPFIGIIRHRINTDGDGIFTLVAFHGCPLRCKYCINPQSWNANGIVDTLSPKELLEIVKIDHLYFLATNGGVTFGGGEPLLYAQFITEFRHICPSDWRIIIETSLNVDVANLIAVADITDKFMIDIKDLNPLIYKSYTGYDNTKTLINLKYLCDNHLQNKLQLRVPIINNYNSPKDVNKTIHLLNEMGIYDIDVFEYAIINP